MGGARRPGLWLASVWLLGCGACGEEPAGPVAESAQPRPILLISVDTLRADHLGLYGYERDTSPEIDRWFGSAEIYEAAYATEANTTPSVVSMLTGQLPQEHGIRLLYQKVPRELPTVADVLSGRGFETGAVVSNTVLTAEASALDAHFDHYDDLVDESELYRPVYERRASRTTDAALAFLDGRPDPGRPLFLWVHYIDPHGPYRPPDDRPTDFRHPEARPIEIERVPAYQREPGVDDGLEYVDRYDEEIAYLDREVGRLLRGYAERGYADRALIVFSADHGESMMEHELWFTHGYHVYEGILRIPLLLRAPGREPARVREPVSNADIAPTLLAYAGIDPPPESYGIALGRAPRERSVFGEATSGEVQWRAMWRGREKWMVRVVLDAATLDRVLSRLGAGKPSRGVIEEGRVYQLDGDPGEQAPRPWSPGDEHPLAALVRSDPDPAGRPREFERGRDPDGPKVVPGLDAEATRRLRALGYVD